MKNEHRKKKEKEWELKNKDKRNAYTRVYAARNKDKMRTRNMKYLSDIDNKFKHLVTEKKRICKQNSLPFDLDVNYIKELFQSQNGKCAITGTVLTWEQGKGKIPFNLSLDRIIPTAGYIKGNVRFVCSIVNTMKFNLTDEELLMWSKRIVAGFQATGEKRILIPNFNTISDLFDRLVVEVLKLSTYENRKREESLKPNCNVELIVKWDRLSRDCCEYRDMLKTAINKTFEDIIANNHYQTLPSNRTFLAPPKTVADLLETRIEDLRDKS